MSTYRERREARAERLIEWAEKREAKAESDLAALSNIGASIRKDQKRLDQMSRPDPASTESEQS